MQVVAACGPLAGQGWDPVKWVILVAGEFPELVKVLAGVKVAFRASPCASLWPAGQAALRYLSTLVNGHTAFLAEFPVAVFLGEMQFVPRGAGGLADVLVGDVGGPSSLRFAVVGAFFSL